MSSNGLVQIRHGEGSFVWYPEVEEYLNPLMPRLLVEREDVLAIMEARSMVEVRTARLAAERATPREVKELAALLEKMEASKDDRREFAKLDHRFHKQVAVATHNKVIIKIYEAIEVFLSQQLEVVIMLTLLTVASTIIRQFMRPSPAVILREPRRLGQHMKRTYEAIMANRQ